MYFFCLCFYSVRSNGKSIVQYLYGHHYIFKIGETPLHVAVRHCHLDVARELLTIVSRSRSRIDAVMLVNQQNWVRYICTCVLHLPV